MGGQAFRFRPEPDGSVTGLCGTRLANLAYDPPGPDPASPDRPSRLLLRGVLPEDAAFWIRTLRLGEPEEALRRRVARDAFHREAVLACGGIRLLRQPLFETLVSFILSARNHIPRIRSLVEALCIGYGERVRSPLARLLEPDRGPLFGFPDPERLMAFRPGSCRGNPPGACRPGARCPEAFGGYRCPAVFAVADWAAALGEGGMAAFAASLRDESPGEAARRLKALPGVGDKVADCVLLYAGIRTDVYPVDTWIERLFRIVYPDVVPEPGPGGLEAIRETALSWFGQDAGQAQLWGFSLARAMGPAGLARFSPSTGSAGIRPT